MEKKDKNIRVKRARQKREMSNKDWADYWWQRCVEQAKFGKCDIGEAKRMVKLHAFGILRGQCERPVGLTSRLIIPFMGYDLIFELVEKKPSEIYELAGINLRL